MEDIPVFPDYSPTLPNAIADAAQRHGAREFLVDGATRLSYRQAERASAHLARGLLALGIGKATRVAIVLPNNADWVLAWWAAARIGALTIPLSTFFQSRELAWALKEADVDTLLIADGYLGQDYVERLERAVPGLADQTGTSLFLPSHPFLRRVLVWGGCDRNWALEGAQALRAAADANPAIDDALLRAVESEVSPADLLIGICTSGSTSQPKIVLHTHGSFVRITHVYRKYTPGVNRDDRVYPGMPFFWLGGFNSGLMPAMYEGACLVFAASPRPEDILESIVREKITRVSMWPVQFKPLVDLAASRGIDLTHTMAHAKIQGPDGKPIPPERRITSLLGMTESFGPHGVGNWGEDLGEKNGLSWGRNLRGVERKIVDPVTRKELPPGQDGELLIRGFPMMQGYYKRERAETLDADGWYATGDTCCLNDEGYLWFKGRLSDMIKTGGANVSPQEVEALMHGYPDISEAIVVGLPDEARGERVVAAVIAKEGRTIDTAALRKQMLGEISSYKVPKAIVVMKYDDVPRTTSGKVQRNVLKPLLAERLG